VLDRFDGTTWYPVSGLLPTGGRVPDPASNAAPGGTKAVQQVTLDQLDGVWLPAADRPSQVSAPGDVGLAVDPDSGTVATSSRVRPGLRYEVVSEIPKYDPDKIQYFSVAHDPLRTELPDRDSGNAPIPALDEFRKIAADATRGSTFPYQQALRLAAWLRDNHRYDVTSVPGHSYRSLQFFLQSSKEGTSEQFASAFAVLARTLGLPTRVVVGFSRGTPGPNGVWHVASGDVVAWPEVEFAGAGWVPFFPTPGQAGRSDTPKNDPDPQQTTQAQQPTTPTPTPTSRADKDNVLLNEARQPATASAGGGRGGNGTPLWWWALPLALLLLGGGELSLAAAAPAIVRRRRQRGSPNRRVFGAWRQVHDQLVEIEMPKNGTLTANEIAAYGVEHLPDEVGARLPALANLVNDLAYADRTATAEDADAAWRDAADVRKAVRRSPLRHGRRTRLARRFAPRQIVTAFRKDDGE
jgi:transglutaminase-like putative cysteine protease